MRATPLRTASLAAALCLTALVAAPGAAAAPCPSWTSQTFNGTLLPGATDTYTVTVWIRGNVTFQFVPTYPFWGPAGQTVTMTLGSSSITGSGSLAMTLSNATLGPHKVQLRGHHLGVDGLAVLPYQLLVSERNCHL
jgi:hypothetical protein